MAVLANSFEGGTPGAAVTTGNSGGVSGDAFDEIDPSSSSILYTADALHGSVACEVVAAVDDDPYFAWASGISATTVWGRVYLKISSAPPDSINVVRHLAGTQTVLTVRVNANRTIGALYSTGSFLGNGSAVIPLDTWVRIEWTVTTGTTTGSVRADLYLSPESETPDDTLQASGLNVGSSAAVTRQRMGMLSSDIWSMTLDSVAFSDEGALGPVGGGTPPANDATLAATLPALAAAAEGTVTSPTVGGTVAATLPPLGADATATARNPATTTAQLPALGATASAAVRDDTSLAATLPALTSSAAATATNPTAATATLPALGAAAAAGIRDDAASAVQLPALQTRFGTGTPPNLAQLAATLPSLAADGTTTQTAPATLDAALPALTADTDTTTTDPATAATELPPLAAALTATQDGPPTATLATELPALTANLAATGTLEAALTTVLPALIVQLTQAGEPLPAVDGTLDRTGGLNGTVHAQALTGHLVGAGRLTGSLGR